jgi:hypothetical protein
MESEPFSLLISDLNMPKMDGLQVLTIVRRKFPDLRTAVMTSVADEQFRARAYAMGVDLFLEKPNTNQEITFFIDCIESLLTKEAEGGFRGVQSKSLVDIIQLEGLSKSSSVMKITHGLLEGRIWMLDGEVIDAVAGDLTGEEAFRKILSWKTGSFEILSAEPERTRTIFNSYQGLLLDAAQAFDEAGSMDQPSDKESVAAAAEPEPASRLAELARFPGVEFILAAPLTAKGEVDSWGVEDPDEKATWLHETMDRFRSLGESLNAGQLNRVEGIGLEHRVALTTSGEADLCVCFPRAVSSDVVRDTMKGILVKWAS